MIITAIIPARCSQEELHRRLDQLERQTTQPHHIVIVDETDDGSLWPPEGISRQVTLVRDPARVPGERNPGFARNYGVKEARYDTTHYLFCDSGILFPSDALPSLVRALPERGIASARWVGLPKTAPKFDNAGEAGEWAKLHGYQPDDGPTPVGYESYNLDHQFTLFPAKLFHELGGYDTATFTKWGLECQDLSLRLLEIGGEVRSRCARYQTGRQLCIYHLWHPANRDPDVRGRQFRQKWGTDFSGQLMQYCELKGAAHAIPKEDADEPSPSPGT